MVTCITAVHYASCLDLFFNLKEKIGNTSCYHCFKLGKLNWDLLGKELFIRFTVLVLRGRLSICECASFALFFRMVYRIRLSYFLIIAFLFTLLMILVL